MYAWCCGHFCANKSLANCANVILRGLFTVLWCCARHIRSGSEIPVALRMISRSSTTIHAYPASTMEHQCRWSPPIPMEYQWSTGAVCYTEANTSIHIKHIYTNPNKYAWWFAKNANLFGRFSVDSTECLCSISTLYEKCNPSLKMLAPCSLILRMLFTLMSCLHSIHYATDKHAVIKQFYISI